jgi:hypothetical protein
MNIGDIGSLFYIILKGQVAVKVPTTLEVEMTPEDFFIYAIQNIEDLDWVKFPNGDNMRQEIASEMSKLGITKDNMQDKIHMI